MKKATSVTSLPKSKPTKIEILLTSICIYTKYTVIFLE